MFQLGTKYSVALDAMYTDEDGEQHPMVMGCYGIGHLADRHRRRRGAPRRARHHVAAGARAVPRAPRRAPRQGRHRGARSSPRRDRLYDELSAAGVEVLYDDRDASPGVKFADADLLGMPMRVTVGAKGLGARDRRAARSARTGEQTEFPSPMPPRAGGPHLIRPATHPATHGRSHMGRFVLGNGPWMTWNVALALLPLLAAVVLFGRDAARRSMLWWAGLVGLVLFLPNAPYVLTDVVHLPQSLRGVRPGVAAEAGVLFTYGSLFTVGVVSYVLSLHLLGDYFARAGWSRRATVDARDDVARGLRGRHLPRALPGPQQLGRASAVRPTSPAGCAASRRPFGAATVIAMFVTLAVVTTMTRWVALGATEQFRRWRHGPG